MNRTKISPAVFFWLVVGLVFVIAQVMRFIEFDQLIFNPALAFSINLPLPAIYAISVLFLGVILWLFYSHQIAQFWGNIGLGLIFGGGIANLIDRFLFDGGVADYWHLLGISTINFADIAITAGIVLVFQQLLFRHES